MPRSILRLAAGLAATWAVLALLAPPAAADDCLYAIDLGPNSSHVTTLYDVDPATGQLGNPRSTGMGNAIGLALGPDGFLYAVTASVAAVPKSLYKIDPTTGASTLVGPLGLSGTLLEGDLAFDPSGTLYGISNQISFFTVDLNTGAATSLPNVGNFNADYSYLAFHPGGTLYALDNGASAGLFPNLWQTVDPSTGAIATSQGKSYYMGPAGGMDWDGIGGGFLLIDSKPAGSSVPGTNSLYRVDLSGNRTLVGSLGQGGLFAGLASCAGDLEPPTGCVDPPPGMTGWYRFDETGGLGAIDFAGFHFGIKTNGPAPAGGKVAGSLELDGIDDHVLVPHTVDYNFDGPGTSGAFTLDAWIRTSGDESGTIVAKLAGSATPTLHRGYTFGVSSGLLYFGMHTEAASPFTHSVFQLDVIQPETWHHVAVTLDRAATPSIVLYVDGQPVETSSSYPQTQTDNTEPLYIGGRIDPDTGQLASLFDGRIDELEIFDRALDPEEIHLLWAAGSYGKCKDACPVFDALGEGPDPDGPPDPGHQPGDLVRTLYQVRDQRLAATENGLYLAGLFQEHRLRMSYLMLRSSELRQATQRVLYDYAPGLRAELEGAGSDVGLSEEMVAEAFALAHLLIDTDLDHGGGELATAVDREIQRIDWPALPGMTFDELWLYLESLRFD